MLGPTGQQRKFPSIGMLPLAAKLRIATHSTCKFVTSVSESCRSLRCSSHIRIPRATPANYTASGCCTKQAQGTLTQTYKSQAPPAFVAVLVEGATFMLIASVEVVAA